MHVTKTFHGHFKGKSLFITTGIADQLHPALIPAIWLEWLRWRQTHQRERLFKIEADRGIEVWVIDDGDHATMLLPDER